MKTTPPLIHKSINPFLLALALTILVPRVTPAQFYQLKTNLFLTNTVALSATLTMTGTNYLDVTRYRTIGIVAIWSGSNTNTNTVTFSFKSGPTATNWGIIPRWNLVGTNYGTNRSIATTNITILDDAYVQPFQVINTCTNSLTNVVVYGQIKEYPRN